MKANFKQAIGSTLVLVLLGMVAFLAGTKWLIVFIPAAMLVWYAASPRMRGGRN